MEFAKLRTNPRAVRTNIAVEEMVNSIVRQYDDTMRVLHLGGRKAQYDDHRFEFLGGASDAIRRAHYDKSLRLLWKAENNAPFLSFRDCTTAERDLMDLALRSLTDEEKAARKRLALPEFKALLNREYTREQKQAIVNILAAIGHGEAYAWLVSAELLGIVKSTGARAALTMQVVEEAKHFVVLRELLQAFDVPIRRQSVWEYLLLESAYKAPGLDKFFGMNIVAEGIALSLFGMMSHLPGLEVLRLFHLDEARHCGLPQNYFAEFPMTEWERTNPRSRARRLGIIMPALALIPYLEGEMAVLGIDVFDFGGSVVRKLVTLAGRNGFALPLPPEEILARMNRLFNVYCKLTRPEHQRKNFMKSDSTVGAAERAVEEAIFQPENAPQQPAYAVS